MEGGAEAGKPSGRWPWTWFIVPGLVLLYVLSIGPAVAIWPGAAPRAVEIFYAPLIWLDENTPLHETFDLCFRLWERSAPGSR